jgi:hypothetical protein
VLSYESHVKIASLGQGLSTLAVVLFREMEIGVKELSFTWWNDNRAVSTLPPYDATLPRASRNLELHFLW